MITKTKWQNERHASAKNCGVGKALDAYNTKCKAPATLKKSEEFEAAKEAAEQLSAAFEKAKGKAAKKAAKDEQAKATVTLIKKQLLEVQKYRLTLQTTWQSKCADVVKLFGDAEALVTAQFKRMLKIEKLVGLQQTQTDKAYTSLMKAKGLAPKQAKAVKKNVQRFIAAGENNAALVDKELDGLRQQKAVTAVRSGSWIGALPPEYKKSLGTRFKKFTGELTKVERKGADVKTACSYLKTTADQLLLLTESGVDMTEAGNKAMEKVKKAVNKQLAPLATLTSKPSDPYAQKAATPPKERKKWNLTVVQGHIKGVDLVFSRTPKLVPLCSDIPLRAQKLLKSVSNKLPKEYRGSKDFQSRYLEIKSVVDEKRKTAEKWAQDWTKNESELKSFKEWLVKQEATLQRKAK